MKSLRTILLLALLLLPLLPAAASTDTPLTSPPYRVGDYYNDGILEGVVFEVDKSGTHGKIVSLTQSPFVRQWATTTNSRNRLIGADNMEYGGDNVILAQLTDNWERAFPAIAWCHSLGAGWYLPAISELKTFTLNPPIYSAVNTTLKSIERATPLPESGTYFDYWSSTEKNFKYASGEYCVWGVNMRNGVTHDSGKSRYAYVRAVAVFPLHSATSELELNKLTTPPYQVGSYYNDGVLRGVVIQVDADGTHGKLLSLIQSAEEIVWATESQLETSTGATSPTDGAANTAKLLSIPESESLYPAAAWCRKLGPEWYLPAAEELKSLFADAQRVELINATLQRLRAVELITAGNWSDYWSSTEDSEGAVGHFLYNNEQYGVVKSSEMFIRAMATF
ncbi:MAG: DUF1566 domain-containing protein [Tidjanibacter sp.]|nr:DUF1566 domain-containing protein [Tidjanibacter sp.]